MAVQLICGWEMGSLHEATGVTSGVTLQSTYVHSGTYAAEFTSGYSQFQVFDNLGQALIVLSSARFYLRVLTLPSNRCEIYGVGAGNTMGTLSLEADGTLTMIINGTVTTSTSALSADGLFHRVEFDLGFVSALKGGRVYVDGTQWVSDSTSTFTIATSRRIGNNSFTGSLDIVVDDIIIEDATLIGGVRTVDYNCALLLPAADSARNNWTGGGGGTSSLFDAVDNVPPVGVADGSATNTSQIRDIAKGGQTMIAHGTISVAAAATVSPTFGSATTAGHLLVAAITSDSATLNNITTTATGWVEANHEGVTSRGSVTIWYKPNCGAGETAPTFTSAGASNMTAILGEFSGMVTSSPVDQTGVATDTASPLAVAASAPNTSGNTRGGVFGVLWTISKSGTVTFSQSAGTDWGDSGATTAAVHSILGEAGAGLGVTADAVTVTVASLSKGVVSGAVAALATFLGFDEAYDADITSYSAAGVSGTVHTVIPVASVAQAGIAPNVGDLQAEFLVLSNPVGARAFTTFGGPSTSTDMAGTYPTGWTTIYGGAVSSPTLTPATQPVVRLVKQDTGTNPCECCFLGLYVDYTPPLTATQPAHAYISAASATTSTQTAKARIATTAAKTQTAAARLAAIKTTAQTAKARLAPIISRALAAASRVRAVATKTQTAKARLSTAFTTAQTAKARIATTKTATQTGKARLAPAITTANVAHATVSAPVTRTQAARARVAIPTASATQIAHARLAPIVSSAQAGHARLQAVRSAAQAAHATVQAPATKAQQGHARLAVQSAATQAAHARIAVARTATQPAHGRAAVQIAAAAPAHARLAVTRTAAQAAHATVQAPDTAAQPARARVAVAAVNSAPAAGRVATGRNSSQPGRARLAPPLTAQQAARATVNAPASIAHPARAYIEAAGFLTTSNPTEGRVQIRVVRDGNLIQNPSVETGVTAPDDWFPS